MSNNYTWNISLNSNEKSSMHLLGKNIWFSGNDVYLYRDNDITIVGYGRIYNEMDLWKLIDKEEKKHHSLQIVVELYNKIGFEKTLEYLDGDFSFVLFDMNLYGEESLLYVVRDYLGLISLYQNQWIDNQQSFMFSSSISKMNTNKTILNGSYMMFTHSFKVSANWKYSSTIQYYQLPFHNTTNLDMVLDKKIEIEKTLFRKIKYIGENKIGIIVTSTSTQKDELSSYLFEYFDKNKIDYKIILYAQPVPMNVCKYIKENEPQIKYIFMLETFINKWIYINPFNRREELNSVFFRERLSEWTDAFFEYGIDLIIPYLDRTLLQKI